MRITNIRIDQKTNLGNYESLEFAAEAVVDEDDNLNNVTTKLTNYVDWNAQKPIRDAKARGFRNLAADEKAPADKRQEALAWLAKYDERKAAVEGI